MATERDDEWSEFREQMDAFWAAMDRFWEQIAEADDIRGEDGSAGVGHEESAGDEGGESAGRVEPQSDPFEQSEADEFPIARDEFARTTGAAEAGEMNSDVGDTPASQPSTPEAWLMSDTTVSLDDWR